MRRYVLAVLLASVTLATTARASIVSGTPDAGLSTSGGTLSGSYNSYQWGSGWEYTWTAADGFFVFNGNPDGSSVAVLRGDRGNFHFDGADFSTWPGPGSASVTITGWLGGQQVGSPVTLTLGSSFQAFTFDATQFSGIDTLEFAGTGWRMNNFADVGGPVGSAPEPTTLFAGALLLLPFGASTIGFWRWHRRA